MTLLQAQVGGSQGNGPHLVVAGAIFRLKNAVEKNAGKGDSQS